MVKILPISAEFAQFVPLAHLQHGEAAINGQCGRRKFFAQLASAASRSSGCVIELKIADDAAERLATELAILLFINLFEHPGFDRADPLLAYQVRVSSSADNSIPESSAFR